MVLHLGGKNEIKIGQAKIKESLLYMYVCIEKKTERTYTKVLTDLWQDFECYLFSFLHFLHFVQETHVNFVNVNCVIEKIYSKKTLNKSSLFGNLYTYLPIFYSIACGTVALEMVL